MPNARMGNTTHKLERGESVYSEANGDKYRILCAHVHILALALAMVAACFHLLLTYEDFKMHVYYRLIRHIPCALLYALVVLGNRTYRHLCYLPYLFLNVLSIVFILVMEGMRQYRIRTDPELRQNVRHGIFFFIGIWTIMVTIEALIYYVIYRDYRFVKDMQGHPPKTLSSVRHKDHSVAPVSNA